MSLKHKLSSYFTSLWNRSNKFSKLSFCEKIVFIFLVFVEKIYFLFFKFVIFIKKKRGSKKVFFKVISIGNISVGGTGKSVFINFLARNVNCSGAIVSRGYGGKFEKKADSTLISNGKDIFFTVREAGDEPYMLAQHLRIPVVVGKNRFKSAKLLQHCCKSINTIFLDDAYQNFSLKKDLEILLLDARKPFGSNHCLPAGNLREKDISRADVIVFTHADKVTNINNLKKIRHDKNVFFGCHKLSKLLLSGNKKVNPSKFLNLKVLAFAGIANFQSFIQSIKDLNLNIEKEIEYQDHYKFIEKDLKNIINIFKKYNCDCIITTSKDWVKIVPIIEKSEKYKQLPIYVLEIEFAFLTNSEKIRFLDMVENVLDT